MKGQRETLLRQLERQLDAGHLAKDLIITYRVAGGSPGERINRHVEISASGKISAAYRNELIAPGGEWRGEATNNQAVLDLLRLLSEGARELVPVENARFDHRITAHLERIMVPRTEHLDRQRNEMALRLNRLDWDSGGDAAHDGNADRRVS